MTQPLSSELLVFPHLGLGDALICNAIFRHLATLHSQVVILCKPHNTATVSFMLRDVPNIETFSVQDDTEAKSACDAAIKQGFVTFGLGFWGSQPFDVKQWDREFYRQANLLFQDRWSQFKVARQPSRELEPPTTPFALVHDDPARNYHIRSATLPKLPIIRIDPAKSGNLFDWWGHIEQATELHFMESSPAILADSLPLIKAKRRVLHHYCRESIAPAYQLDWEHLR